jgi:hypothetical protein
VRLLSDVGLSTLCNALLGKPLGEQGKGQLKIFSADVAGIAQQHQSGHLQPCSNSSNSSNSIKATAATALL